jgi:hypothetical protein
MQHEWERREIDKKLLVGKLEGKRLLGIYRRGREFDIVT